MQNKSDSQLKSAPLYQKGKKNLTTGWILLGTGVVTGLIAMALDESRSGSMGWQIGPSDSELFLLLGATVGTFGIVKLIQGGARMQKARSGIGMVSYQPAPGQQAQMPVLTMHWSLSSAWTKKKRTETF